jgi:hypothetical protein
MIFYETIDSQGFQLFEIFLADKTPVSEQYSRHQVLSINFGMDAYFTP